jgi:DNA-binding NarL/FixJ family response regulator
MSKLPSGGPALHDSDEASGGLDTQARILIVEDDYFVATALEQDLADAGFEVVGIAATAEEALHLARLHQPKLAVMDIRLAGKTDGIDAAVELRAQFGIGSIFATAHGDATTRARATKAQPLGWLVKPYSRSVMVQMIRTVLARLPDPSKLE